MVRVCITENVLRAGECVSEDVCLHFHEFCIFKLLCMWMQVFLEKVRDRVSGCRDFCHRGVGGVCWKRVGVSIGDLSPLGPQAHVTVLNSPTRTHTEVRTLFLLLSSITDSIPVTSYPPFLRHTVIRSSSVSCTTSFLVCLDSAGKTGKSALESSTEACDNVMLASYLYLSLQSLFQTPCWLNDVRASWTETGFQSINKLTSAQIYNCTWRGANVSVHPGVVFSSQLIKAGADKYQWLLQSQLTWE